MLTSDELAIILARDNDVNTSIARGVVENCKRHVTGLNGYYYDAELDVWLTMREKVIKEFQQSEQAVNGVSGQSEVTK